MKMSDVFALPLQHRGECVADNGCACQWVTDLDGHDVLSDCAAFCYSEAGAAARAINMHDDLVEALSDMVEQFADFDDDTGELKSEQLTIVNIAMELIAQAEGGK